jgi:hypothetical protein
MEHLIPVDVDLTPIECRDPECEKEEKFLGCGMDRVLLEVAIVMLEMHSATDLPRLRISELFDSIPHRRLIRFESNMYGVRYGPFRVRLFQQERLSNARYLTFA